MGKKIKKGTEGNVIKYIARTQAIRKLQISLSQFRRLCILKGIYPVEPSNKRKVAGGSTALKTFYYRKDVKYLLHEPILGTLRQERIHARKLGKAIGKKQFAVAKQIQEDKPVYTLDHIIKERYPTFIDAVRDLDDALSMISLFSTLPSDEKVHADHIKDCQRLLNEFQHYIIMTGCLKKVFLSIKGIYYQIEVRGQTITWISPYQFSQSMPNDVDFRVMSTFLEVHETLLSFVNYKLYSDLNFVYPPKLDNERFEAGAGIEAYILESKEQAQKSANILTSSKKTKQFSERVKSLESKMDELEDDDEETQEAEEEEEDESAPLPVVIPTTVEEQVVTMAKASLEGKRLFDNSFFWLSREVPRYSLEFVIKASGGRCGWDASSGGGSPFLIDDKRITHQITDRPLDPKVPMVEGREYLQPQWIYDCVNATKLVKTNNYHPGEKLPSHLSPFVVAGVDDYSPDQEIEDEEMVQEEVSPEDDHTIEIMAEAAGIPFSEFKPEIKKVSKKAVIEEKGADEKEAKELSKMMMSKRDKKLYDKIQFGKARKQEAANKLMDKKRKTKNQ